MKRYCEERGITHQTTAPYSPQSNGVAERYNRTLANMVRPALKDLPPACGQSPMRGQPTPKIGSLMLRSMDAPRMRLCLVPSQLSLTSAPLVLAALPTFLKE